MTHPLTDNIIHAKKLGYEDDYGNWYYDEDDIRAAADWQLEQVIEWIRSYPRVGEACPIYDFETEHDRSLLIADLKKAMRRQEDNS